MNNKINANCTAKIVLIAQQNACLSRSDAKLFYKIYFGLLEFTNKKYEINKHVKIYNSNGINPYEISGIVDKFLYIMNLKYFIYLSLPSQYKSNDEKRMHDKLDEITMQ